MEVAVEEEFDVPRLSPAVEVAAYRIGVEALTNVARHADDKRAELGIKADGNDLMLRVVDHGRGSADAIVGVGVLSMRERAEELGGTLTIRETPGGGTTVEARLPVATSNRPPR
jgi:signal transduction histidine kinase